MDVLGPVSSANDIPTKVYVDTAIATQHTTDTGTYGRFSIGRYGRVPAWVGDSITVGAGSSNSTVSAFVVYVPKILGYALVSEYGTNSGVTGDKSADVLARMDAVLATAPEFVHLQIGTNDAGNSVSVSTYAANVTAIHAKCDAAGVPMTIGTVPPRASSAGTTVRDLVRGYNLWMRMWAPRAGVGLADTFGALVDPATGYLSSANDSGDGVHPGDAGHLAIANAISTMLRTRLPVLPWPVVTAGAGLIADPLMAANPGDWDDGPNATISLVAASGGDVPVGAWKRFTATNATGSTVYDWVGLVPLTTGFTAGDILLVCAYLRGSTQAALNKFQVWNQGFTVRNVLMESAPSATPGPFMKTITVQSGDTTLYFTLLGAIPAGGSCTIDIGAFDIFNLTALGLGSTVF